MHAAECGATKKYIQYKKMPENGFFSSTVALGTFDFFYILSMSFCTCKVVAFSIMCSQKKLSFLGTLKYHFFNPGSTPQAFATQKGVIFLSYFFFLFQLVFLITFSFLPFVLYFIFLLCFCFNFIFPHLSLFWG